MPRQNSQITAILNRLHKKLSPADRSSITQSLVDYMVAHNLRAEDFTPTDDFLDLLLPGIQQENVDWEGLATVKDILGTEVKRRFYDQVKNLKSQGTRLNTKVAAAKDLFDEEHDSYESVSKFQKTDKHSQSPMLKLDQQTPDDQD